MASKKKDPQKEKNQAPPATSVTDKTTNRPGISGKAAELQEPPRKPAAGFPIVGIGASAGGLAAVEAFFSGMPTDTDPDMAFVLVQHLAPDHKSILTELIQRSTRMQVFEVENGMTVHTNCAYVIPPGRDMAFLNGTLQLLEPSAPRGRRLPIDFFFRSLAQDQHERAICIVLSGTGSDGTMGLRSIKGEGGMVMVQNPESADYDSMPRSAIGTGLVDYKLPPAEMPARLIAYAAQAFGRPPQPAIATPPSQVENAFEKIFILLRNKTGHDLSQYKLHIINRHIVRRMAVHQLESVEMYVKYLQQTPSEVESLFRDLLIGETNFFRDPKAFKAIEEQIIPKIFAGKPAGAVIRIWSAGCSTGEEAYSLAILLHERMETMRKNYKVQVFATDIDRQAIATARVGLYPGSIAADISPDRLARFFTAEPHGTYRIHKAIRDMLVFSEQSVIKDPPFSRLDLISCRNLLIYMGGDLQKKLIALLHYALGPGGFLFLGTAETVDDFAELFSPLDHELKLYQRKELLQSAQRTAQGRLLPPLTQGNVLHPRNAGRTTVAGKLSFRELTELTLLQQVAPAGALVNSNGDILYLHGRTGMYLEPPPCVAGVNNILKMAREGLQRELTTALHHAVTGKKIVRCLGLGVETNGDFAQVNLTIRPVFTDSGATSEVPLYMVIFEEVTPLEPVNGELSSTPDIVDRRRSTVHIASLKQELQAKEEYLQAANEELATANEEMQSMNEELQATNEELETSKEEMQSINEELFTVNAELQTKVSDLSRANNDMNNLLAGTGIATVFVDHQLRILRFTPAIAGIINLIMSDIGRPLGHIVSKLVGYDHLLADTQAVLDTLVQKEIEAQTTEGKWYALRIQPYRTQDNIIEGAVITFVDITEMKKIREALRKANELLRLAVAVRDSHDAVNE